MIHGNPNCLLGSLHVTGYEFQNSKQALSSRKENEKNGAWRTETKETSEDKRQEAREHCERKERKKGMKGWTIGRNRGKERRWEEEERRTYMYKGRKEGWNRSKAAGEGKEGEGAER